MAWGTLKEVGWVNAFTSGKYATDNYVKYQIDESSRKLRVIVTRQRVRSLGSAYSYNGNVNNGCRFLGGEKDSQYFDGYDTEDIIVVTGGGSALIPSNSDRTIGRVYTYNNDGSVPSITLSTQMIFDLYDPNNHGFSQQNWKSQELKSNFPTIAKKAPNPVKDIIVTGVTTSTISISFTASSDASSYLVDWGTVNSTDETEDDMLAQGNATITDTTYTITNLDKNQLYLIMITSLGSDGTGDDNSREIGYGKTLNVDPVTNVSVTEVSTTSITVKFDSSQYAIKYSAIAISTDDSGTASQTFSTTVSTSPATITGLSPNTKYKVGVSAIGTNNDLSDYVYVDNVTTLAKKISPATNLQVTKVTGTSISVSFTGSEGAIKYYIEATISGNGGVYKKRIETTDTKGTITNLLPDNEYNIGVCAVDSNGIESDWVEIDNITMPRYTPVVVNVDGIAKKVIFAYINVNGVAKDVMAIYANVNGTAKKII